MKPFLSTLISVLLVTAAFNLGVDPGHRWRSSQFNFSKNWSDLSCWVVPTQFDERNFRASHIQVIEKPNLLILSSSRGEVFDSLMFDSSQKIYNSGMGGGSAWDYVSIWQTIKETGKIPKRLIIVADTWILNRNTFAKYRWTSNYSAFHRFMTSQLQKHPKQASWLLLDGISQKISGTFYEWLEPINASVTKASLNELKNRFSNPKSTEEIVEISSRPMNAQAIKSDGSKLYSEAELHVSPAELRTMAANTGRGSLYVYLLNWEFYQESYDLLELLIRDARVQDVQVLMIAPPFHPLTWKIMNHRHEYQSIPKTFSSSISDLTKKYPGFQFCDASDPELSGCSEEEFMDSTHMQRSCAKKVMRRCLNQTSDWKISSAF